MDFNVKEECDGPTNNNEINFQSVEIEVDHIKAELCYKAEKDCSVSTDVIQVNYVETLKSLLDAFYLIVSRLNTAKNYGSYHLPKAIVTFQVWFEVSKHSLEQLGVPIAQNQWCPPHYVATQSVVHQLIRIAIKLARSQHKLIRSFDEILGKDLKISTDYLAVTFEQLEMVTDNIPSTDLPIVQVRGKPFDNPLTKMIIQYFPDLYWLTFNRPDNQSANQ